MSRALFGKEWRQLRALRWGGAGIGLLMPPLLLALAAAGERGWLFSPISEASVETILRELLPMVLALAIWPLLALMVVSQAFLADRAAGTEAFLLQRPVPRARIWRMRLLAALATTGTILTCHTVVWWIALWIVGGTGGIGLGTLWLSGGPAAMLATLGGAAATAFVRAPMQGVLLGAMLGMIPLAAASLLSGGGFGGYSLAGFNLGMLLPVPLVACYLVGSFVADCRGEPAGGGRLRRALVAVVAGLVAMPLLLAATAPAVLRLDARLALGNTRVVPAPAGDRALVLNNRQFAGWLIDVRSRERVRFMPPPVFAAAWSDDGGSLAVLHAAGRAGRWLVEPRLEILDASGRPSGRPIECPECRSWWGMQLAWSGDRLVVAASVDGGEGLVIVDPASGRRRAVSLPKPVSTWSLSEAADTGELFVVRVHKPAGERGPSGGLLLQASLHRLDVENGTLGPSLPLPGWEGSPWHFWLDAISPSGRFWLQRSTSGASLLDLETGAETALPGKQRQWLAGDRLTWVDWEPNGSKRMVVSAREERELVRTEAHEGVRVLPSPDRRRLLVTLQDEGKPAEHRLYDATTGAWEEVHLAVSHTGDLAWAGEGTLALFDQGSLALFDLRAGETEYVIGGP